MRHAASGALSGAVAGLVFGVCALTVQRTITDRLIARYGYDAVDHGAFFLHPEAAIQMTFLGAFLGVIYVAARQRFRWLTGFGGLVFAIALTLGLQPLLAVGFYYFSAVVEVQQAGLTKCCLIEDVAPRLLLGSLMSGLLFVEGSLMRVLALGVPRWLPRLPAAVYAVVAVGLGVPGLVIYGAFLFLVLFPLG